MKKNKPVLIVILLIIIIAMAGIAASIVKKYQPTKDRMDQEEYYGTTEDNQLPLVVGTELLEGRGTMIDNQVYLPLDVVNKYLNSRFYWNENEEQMNYTTPTSIFTIIPEQKSYLEGNKEKSTDFIICSLVDGTVYLNADFVKTYTNMDYELLENPNRVVINYQWEKVSVVTAEKDCELRYRGGIKSEILTDVKKGDTLRLIEEFEDWDQVASADGYIGFVPKKSVSAISEKTYERDFAEPEYTSISKDETINLAWHQVTSQDANALLGDTIAKMTGVNVISPTWFSMKDNKGNITSLASESYVTEAHNSGLEVWGLVDNFSSDVNTLEVLSNSKSRTQLINRLIAEATQYNLDGINVDLESISEETGPHYVEFIRELSVFCRENKLVLSIDDPVPENFTSHYDRAAQGEVADYVIIMGYDEHYDGSEEAGSVSSLPWVEQGIKDTLAEVPAEKVINGIPFYTRLWKTGTGAVTSQVMGMDEAQKYIADNNIETIWDGSVGQNVGTLDSDSAQYQIWLEDAQSIAEKVKLIKQYELAGVAEWKLGFENSNIWSVISENLK